MNGFFNKRMALSLAVALLGCAAPAMGGDVGFRSFNEIESALDPLEVIAVEDGIRRSIDLDIRFAFGSARLDATALRQLEVLGSAMKGERLRAYRFKIVGHTDAVGSAEANLRLSRARARAVVAWLVKHGVARARLVAEGRGESELLDHIPPDSPRQRRVEIIAVAQKGQGPGKGAGDGWPAGIQREGAFQW